MTPEEQLELWVQGKPVHNKTRDECCPDFSCCDPDLLAPTEVRKAFKAASEKERLKFLGQFLGALLAKHTPEKKVRILTDEHDELS